MASPASKVLRVKTTTATHITIRDGAGKKLFDMDGREGVSVTVAVAGNAEIQVDPQPAPRSDL
jgi:hypothetical protein